MAEGIRGGAAVLSAGKHDDQVDALGLVGQLLDKMIRGTARKPEVKEPRDSWAKLFDREDLGVVA